MDIARQVPADVVAGSTAGLFVRVSRGVGALSLNAAANLIGQLSIVPVALYVWGEIRYGEWVVLAGLVSLLKVGDLGLQSFVVNRLCASYARDDREGMRHVLHGALRVLYLLASVLLVLISVALLVVPLDRALALQTVDGPELFAVALLLAIEVLIGVPMGVIAGVYRATGRLARAGIVGTCQQLAIIGFTLGMIAGQTGFLSLASARVGVALVTSLWIIYDLKRLYPWLQIWPTSGTWREGVCMIGPGLFFLLIILADYVSNQFPLLVIQKMLDGGEVSRLATHRTVVNLAHMVSALLIHAVWPELTTLYARAENERLVQVHRSLTKFNMWLVGAVAFGMLPFVPWIYPSWTVGRLALDKWTLVFLIIRLLVWAMWSPSMTLLSATNRHQYVALGLLGAAAVSSILTVGLVPMMGISGAVLAVLLGDICIPAWLVPSIASWGMGERVGKCVRAAGADLIGGIGIPVGLGVVGWQLFPSPLLRYMLVVPISFAIALSLIWRRLDPFERLFVASVYQTRFNNGRWARPLWRWLS